MEGRVKETGPSSYSGPAPITARGCAGVRRGAGLGGQRSPGAGTHRPQDSRGKRPSNTLSQGVRRGRTAWGRWF